MTLPAFATLEAFAARLPGGVSDDDETRARAALDDASTLIRAEAGKDWVTDDEPAVLADDLPDIVVTVCIAAARRAFTNPDGIRSESLLSHSVTLADSSADVYLTTAERRMIATAAGRTGGGISTLSTTRGPLETAGCGDLLDPTVEEFPIQW
jgi:hypothetical protein